MKQKQQTLKNISIFQPKTKIDILKQFVSNNQNPHRTLEQYAQDHYHTHTLYGMITEGPRKNQLELYLYKKPNRKDPESHKTKTILSIKESKDEILNKTKQDLKKLILLKENPNGEFAAINFYESIKRQEVVPSIIKNPYYHDHFIYLSLVSKKKAEECFRGFAKHLASIRHQFNQNMPYTVTFILLNNPSTLFDTLIKKLKKNNIISKLKKGSIYLIIDAHCSSGSNTVSGEFPEDEDKQWPLHAETLASLIMKFQIPLDAHFDIDVYACSPGQFEGTEHAFCLRLNDIFVKKHYTNLFVKGNVYTTYSDPDLVTCESPSDVAVFGNLREPPSSIEQIKLTEVYHRIQNYPTEDIDSRHKDVILSLKKYADNLLLKIDEFESFYDIYQLLQIKFKQFEELQIFVKKTIENFSRLINKTNQNHLVHYKKIKSSFLEQINKIYIKLVFTLNFTEALISIKQISLEHREQLINMYTVCKTKDKICQHSVRLFSNATSMKLLNIIKQAENENITYKEASKEIEKLTALQTSVPLFKLKRC